MRLKLPRHLSISVVCISLIIACLFLIEPIFAKKKVAPFQQTVFGGLNNEWYTHGLRGGLGFHGEWGETEIRGDWTVKELCKTGLPSISVLNEGTAGAPEIHGRNTDYSRVTLGETHIM